MRDTFQKELIKLAKKNEDLFLLTGDLGYGVFDEYEKKFPKRYINVGVAEQNLIGISTGLALEGKTVIAYSIANFLVLRCLEQIRNDAVYHNLNINLVSSGGGYTYGVLGMSHHATEDLSVLNSIPGISIAAPSTKWETKKVFEIFMNVKGTTYIRLEKNGSDLLPLKNNYRLGELIKYQSGNNKLAIVCLGGVFVECFKAVKNLENKKITPSLYTLSSLKPLNKKKILSTLRNYDSILTVEENNYIGGLGSTISHLIHTNNKKIKFFSLSTQDTILKIVGDQNFLRKKVGIDCASIQKKILKIYS